MLAFSVPPGYRRRRPPARPKLDPFAGIIDGILTADDRFGRPGKGYDKGKVEGLIGWIRRNLLVPVPRAVSLMALNEQLLEGCRRRFGNPAARSRPDDRRTAGAGSGGVPRLAASAL